MRRAPFLSRSGALARVVSICLLGPTGANSKDLGRLFGGEGKIAFVTKPYPELELLNALSSLGIRARPKR